MSYENSYNPPTLGFRYSLSHAEKNSLPSGMIRSYVRERLVKQLAGFLADECFTVTQHEFGEVHEFRALVVSHQQLMRLVEKRAAAINGHYPPRMEYLFDE